MKEIRGKTSYDMHDYKSSSEIHLRYKDSNKDIVINMISFFWKLVSAPGDFSVMAGSADKIEHFFEEMIMKQTHTTAEG